MRKSDLIARFLLRGNIVSSLDAGLDVFLDVWDWRFDHLNLAEWNTEVPQHVVDYYLTAVAAPTRVHVGRMIEDLT